MSGPEKTPQDQITELRKLVVDAEEKLDQVLRGLRSLEERLANEASSEPNHRPRRTHP
jgi:uncharacterized coiled-coil protein SlyX